METRELVSINEMEEVENKTKSLVNLINEMKELDQGKIDRKTFEKARDVIECSICDKVISKSAVEDRVICHECHKEEIRKEREEKQYQIIKTKWNQLLNDLNEADEMGDNSYVLNEIEQKYGMNNFNIVRIKGNIKTTIYRDDIRSGSNWHSRIGHALRILTNDYDINANRLKKDFDAKDIAQSLHKKCNELISKIEAKNQRANEKKNKEQNMVDNIISNFPNVKKEDINQIYYPSYGRQKRESYSNQREFRYMRTTIKTYDGIGFTVNFVSGEFNADQIKKVVEFHINQIQEMNVFVKNLTNA